MIVSSESGRERVKGQPVGGRADNGPRAAASWLPLSRARKAVFVQHQHDEPDRAAGALRRRGGRRARRRHAGNAPAGPGEWRPAPAQPGFTGAGAPRSPERRACRPGARSATRPIRGVHGDGVGAGSPGGRFR
ncbi:hypothetical protein SFR_0044 [Streptomyces sp. FR-008]|nr:hypothetical protein SFR_0044 [Streptomyces sp. FR-008]